MDPMDFDRDELLAIFSAETEDNLREMEEAFVRLESAPDDVETLQAVFRAAHTIKGNAGGLGFPALARFAHALEDVLDRIRSGSLALSTSIAKPWSSKIRFTTARPMPMPCDRVVKKASNKRSRASLEMPRP